MSGHLTPMPRSCDGANGKRGLCPSHGESFSTAQDLRGPSDGDGVVEEPPRESGDILENTTTQVYEPYADIAKLVESLFGFKEPLSQWKFPKQPLTPLERNRSLGNKCWKGLGDTRDELLGIFLAYLRDATSIQDIPPQLLDLRQQDAEISLQSNWSVTVNRERLNGNVFYVLGPRARLSQGWPVHILLSSAATVLQVGWGADIQELISRLLHHGVEFRACVRNQIHHPPNRLVPSRVLGGVEFRACVRNQLHRPPGRLFPNRVLGLESRPVGYIPTLVDHDLYVNQRESFLRSPRGRAALLAGGIIGRLARDIADERSVFNGPSDGVLTTGVCLWNETNAIAYWDDTPVTEDEIDLICGVYRIATGHDAEQVSTPSWWPKPAAFAKSGLGIGWWSPDCEFWFQKRLRDIQAGKAELHTQTMWRRYLRLVKTAHEVAEANNTISAEFLNNVLAQI